MAATVVLCVLFGQWLDRKVGTDGIFTIVAPLLGFGGVMYSLMRALSRSDQGDR